MELAAETTDTLQTSTEQVRSILLEDFATHGPLAQAILALGGSP